MFFVSNLPFGLSNLCQGKGQGTGAMAEKLDMNHYDAFEDVNQIKTPSCQLISCNLKLTYHWKDAGICFLLCRPSWNLSKISAKHWKRTGRLSEKHKRTTRKPSETTTYTGNKHKTTKQPWKLVRKTTGSTIKQRLGYNQETTR